MNHIREYRMPLMIAGGALVVAIILWVALIAPQNSKLSGLQAQSVTLQAQEASLQARLAALQSEGHKLSSNCADLQKISTQIPSVTTPNDINAQESSFQSQLNALLGSSGVTLAQFSGFAPTTATAAAAAAGAAATASGVTAVPTTLAVQGNYGQITSFVNGLDSFPRLFVIQKFVLATGAASGAAASSAPDASQSTGSAAGSNTGSASVGGTPLWIGGQQTAASAGPYNLLFTGSIYYTSTANALTACSKATAAQTLTK